MARPFASPLARSTDPETSSDAATAAQLGGTVTRHELLILEALHWMPAGGTASEIAESVRGRHGLAIEQFNNVTVSRRMTELRGRSQVHRRRDLPDAHGACHHWRRRGGETIYWLTPRDAPLFGE
jgi:hypothetical protein